MKLKALLLVAMAAAGVTASIAVADNGKKNDKADKGKACRAQHISGTVAPQTFTITVTHAPGKSSVAPGSTVTVTIGAGSGQTVRATVDGCSTTTTSSALTVRSVDLKVAKVDRGHHVTTTTATTTTTHCAPFPF